MNLVVGLTGANASGKGEVASYLASLGFTVHSLSDIVREEAAARNLPPEREHLIRIGNLLRGEHGAGVLAERLLPRLGNRDVVDSIRNPAEVEVLRRRPDFHLLAVNAPVEVRFERSLERKRPGDPTTLEGFIDREREENLDGAHRQQLEATSAMADRIVENDGDIEALHRKLDRLLEELVKGDRFI